MRAGETGCEFSVQSRAHRVRRLLLKRPCLFSNSLLQRKWALSVPGVTVACLWLPGCFPSRTLYFVSALVRVSFVESNCMVLEYLSRRSCHRCHCCRGCRHATTAVLHTLC